MKLIKPSYKVIGQEPGIEGIYKQIELAARNCYKSEPVEEVSSKDFVDRMIKSQHLSTLEHGTVYLKVPYDKIIMEHIDSQGRDILENPWVKYVISYSNSLVYISSNYRWIYENSLENWLQYLCEPTEFHERRITVKFTSNIHFYKDITRHRKMSYSIESTRYCNYSKNRFGSELTFIIPVWLDLLEDTYWYDEWKHCYFTESNDKPVNDETTEAFLAALEEDEERYIQLINNGWQAQQAAEVLPQATKADIIVTGFVSDWQHIFNLRTSIIAATGKPHPEVSRLMDPLYNEFKEKRLI